MDLTLLIIVIVAAVIFDFINGFHDAANAIATVVSTRVLSIRKAVLLAAVFNLIGACWGTAVAKTIATDFMAPELATQLVVLSALIGACIWNLLTWWWGIPSSSSHALIGGLAGAACAIGGWKAFAWHKLVKKVIIPLVTSPIVGFLLGFVIIIALLWLFYKKSATQVTKSSRIFQLISASVMAFAHGSNDAQKSMGIICLAMAGFAAKTSMQLPHWLWPFGNHPPTGVPLWIILLCAMGLAVGTAAGGRRIIKTMGTRMLHITPLQGVAAESASAFTILMASHFGIPLSTTHCITSSIMGVGAAYRFSAVRWGVAKRIVWAWIVTLPLSGLFGYLSYLVLHYLLGVA